LALSTDEGLTRISKEGAVLWQDNLAAHHELCPAEDGSFLTATHTTHEYKGRRVRFDEIQRVSPEGVSELVLDLFDLRHELCKLGSPSPLDTKPANKTDAVYDRFHLNSIQILPDSSLGRDDARFRMGNLLLCLRNADLVVILDPHTHAVLWHLGQLDLDRPHGARMNKKGHLILFDNGWHRGRSRVLVMDLRAGELLREEDGHPDPFFTRTRGYAEQLGKGRLLITLSEEGRVLELDRAGNKVFEWWSPYRSQGPRSALYRVRAAPVDFPPQ
jgi:hypothetical protein